MITSQTILLKRAEPSSMDSGVFTWDLAGDRFFADSAFAQLFGLDPEKTMVGMPMQRYISRVHPEDVARVARSIHNAVVFGTPCQQNYRVQASNGRYSEIMAFGRCFRSADGTPTQYAGIIMPATAAPTTDSLLQGLCSQAYATALNSGQVDVAKALLDVLANLSQNPGRSPKEYTH